MGKYNFDKIIDRKGTRSTKWDCGNLIKEAKMAERFDEDTIPAFTADMDFACPPAIVEGMHRITEQQIYGYVQMDRDDTYRRAVCEWHKSRYGWMIQEDEIIYVNGTINALIRAVLSFTEEGDGIVVQKPVYSPFQMIIENSKRRLLDNHLINEGGYYRIDFADLEEKLKRNDTAMMILCSPHNPVGRVWKGEELRRVCELCHKYGVILAADEIHADLIRCNVTFTPCAMAGCACRMIICTGINKSFNVAGLQCTNVVIQDKELREIYQEDLLAQVGPVVPTPFAIEAVIQAYTNCREWLDEVKMYIDGNMEWVERFLKEKLPKVRFWKPEGTYVVWMDFSYYGSTDDVFRRLNKNANLLLDKGSAYGEEGYIRACIPVPRKTLQEIFVRIYMEFGGDVL